jgi:hypothetical protein
MTRLCDVAKLIRSKNAGPFQLTIDVLFGDVETLRAVAATDLLRAERIAAIYHLDPSTVQVFVYEAGLAIKVSFPRPIPSGSPADFDVTGGQHYAPLVDLELPEDWKGASVTRV